MSLKIIEKEILRFLSTEEPEVICIKGKWGIGKSHLWNSLLKKSYHNKQIKFKTYSYVSLFGSNSLAEVKTSIIENTVEEADLLSTPNIETFNKLINKNRKFKNLLQLFENAIAKKGILDSLANLSFLSIDKQIICFDDLERISKSLSVTEIMGLASNLKELRGCKVAILVNNSTLGEKEKLDFDRYLEKTADSILEFTLTPAEACDIVFQENTAEYLGLIEACEFLELNNIRIIQKTLKKYNLLKDLIDGMSLNTQLSLIRMLVLSCCSIYATDVYPPYSFLSSNNNLGRVYKREQEELASNPNLAVWDSIVNRSRIYSVYPIHHEILESVKRGYFNEENFKVMASFFEETIKNKNGDKPLNYFWEYDYRGSLAEDDDVVLAKLYDATLSSLNKVTLSAFNTSVSYLRAHGEQDKAKALVDAFLKSRETESKDFWNIHEHGLIDANDIDFYLKIKMDEKFHLAVDKRNLKDVLWNISLGKANDSDFIFLLSTDKDEFKSVIFELRGDELDSIIRSVYDLRFQKNPYANDVASYLTEHFKYIASLSTIRAERLRGYGFIF